MGSGIDTSLNVLLHLRIGKALAPLFGLRFSIGALALFEWFRIISDNRGSYNWGGRRFSVSTSRAWTRGALPSRVAYLNTTIFATDSGHD